MDLYFLAPAIPSDSQVVEIQRQEMARTHSLETPWPLETIKAKKETTPLHHSGKTIFKQILLQSKTILFLNSRVLIEEPSFSVV